MFYSDLEEAYNLPITEAYKKSINNLSNNTSNKQKETSDNIEKFFSGNLDLNQKKLNKKEKKVSFSLTNNDIYDIDSIEDFDNYEYFEHLEEKISNLINKNNNGFSIKEDLINVSKSLKRQKK